MQESFFTHQQFLYLKLGLLSILASIVAYAWHDPVDGPKCGAPAHDGLLWPWPERP